MRMDMTIKNRGLTTKLETKYDNSVATATTNHNTIPASGSVLRNKDVPYIKRGWTVDSSQKSFKKPFHTILDHV
jgi:hypothetical protein